MSKFVITTRKNGEFQFNLVINGNDSVLVSEGYTTKAACLNGVESVKKNSPEDGRYERKTSSNGKFYFNLKASNGQVIGTSEMYASETERENAIQAVKSNAPSAVVEDTTA
ncbi:MAG: YegP family protein [Chitinophagales bacterium]|nr:YegP family protein [Chitinophagales bacterium]MDW8273656.1 YegP family protein [Chitinophagales bacterium]